MSVSRRGRLWFRWLLALVMLAPALALVPPAPPATAQAGGTLTVAISIAPDTLDPAKYTAAITNNWLNHLFDPLLRKDPQTGQLLPGLATSWETSDGGTRLTLKLRTDVKFHDGRPLTSEDVKFHFDRAMDPATRSVGAKQALGPFVKAETPDSSTVVMTFERPFAVIFDYLAGNSLAPSSKAAVEAKGADYGQNPVGTGPYQFKEWVPDDRVVLVKNPDYNWGPSFAERKGPPAFDEIVFRIIPEAATQLALFDRGEVDIVWNVQPRDAARYQRGGQAQIFTAYRPGVPVNLMFNLRKPPFDDVRVRQAIAYALRKDEIMLNAYEGFARDAHGPLTPGLYAYNPEVERQAYTYNPDRAKQLLAEAGYRPGAGGALEKDGQRLRFDFPTISNVASWRALGETVQAQLAEIGVDADLRLVEQNALLPAVSQQHDFQMTIWPNTSTDPDVLFFVFSGKATQSNVAGYANDKVTELLDLGRTETDLTRRAEHYLQAQLLILADAPLVPLMMQPYPYAVGNNLTPLKFDQASFMLTYDMQRK